MGHPLRSIEVLLLSRDDIVALALTPGEVVAVVEDALREHAAGTCEMHLNWTAPCCGRLTGLWLGFWWDGFDFIRVDSEFGESFSSGLAM